MQGIYKITNLTNGHAYIGKAKNLNSRKQDHFTLAVTPNHKEYDKALYQAIRKYGVDSFVFEVIEELEDYSISSEREKYWIAYYDTYNNGYNETPGGDGGSVKGHCLGEKNGRALLSLEDVEHIRDAYAEGKAASEVYSLYQNKISRNGFNRVWTGKTWKQVKPEVFSVENKITTTSKGRSLGAKKQRLLTDEEVRVIRKRRDAGEGGYIVFRDFQNKVSKSTFEGVWYDRTYRDVK